MLDIKAGSLSCALRRMTQLLVIPLGEFFVLRLIFHFVLGLRIGYPGLTDYDFIPPAIIASFVFVLVLEQRQQFKLSTNGKRIALHLALIACFVILTVVGGQSALSQPRFVAGWYWLAACAIGSGVFVQLPLRTLVHPETRRIFWLAILAASSKVVFLKLFAFLWEPATHATGVLVFLLTQSFFPHISYEIMPDFVRVSAPLHTIAVGRGCSGLEGMAFMATLLPLLLVLGEKRLSRSNTALYLGYALLYMYLLNILRISFFFAFAILVTQICGASSGVLFATAVFHNSIGWITYSLGICFFLTATQSFWLVFDDKATKGLSWLRPRFPAGDLG